jgi:hypothetical protein
VSEKAGDNKEITIDNKLGMTGTMIVSIRLENIFKVWQLYFNKD